MPDAPEWRGVRSRRWTYAETIGEVPWLLFDNEADPWQLNNLVDQASYHHLQQELAADLAAKLTSSEDPVCEHRLVLDSRTTSSGWKTIWRWVC